MDTRKVTLIATIAVIALVAVGVGYAYTATTVTNTNTITETSIVIYPYDEAINSVTVGTTEPDYTGSAKNVTYNTYDYLGTITYNIDGIYSLSEIQTIAIKWTDPGNSNEVNLSALSMSVSNASIDTYLTENPDCITVSLSDGSHTWNGTYNTTDKCWDISVASNDQTPVALKASKAGTKYSLTFQTDDEGDDPENNAFEHSGVLNSAAFTISFKGEVSTA